MIGVGCVLTFCSFVGLVCAGSLVAQRRGLSAWLGLAAGVTAWLAAMLGYGVALTIRDWWERDKYPRRARDPAWAILAIWVLFLALSAGAFFLWRRLCL